MNISSVAAAVSNSNTAQLASDVSIKMLNKALDFQESSALQLLEAIPELSAITSNPPNLGNTIDVTA